MRTPLSPRLLAAAGLILLIAAAAWFALLRPASHGPRAVSGPAPSAPPATTSPVPQFGIASAGAASVSALAATVTWTTTEPATGTVAWGPAGTQPLLWKRETAPATTHAVTLDGLSLATPYDVTVEATNGRNVVRRSFSFTTAAAPAGVTASVGGGTLLVDGAPFMPMLAWQECPGQWASDLSQGISLFAGNPCTGLGSLLSSLGGRALATGTTDDTAVQSGPGLIGWFRPDEADGRGLSASTLPAPGPGLRFLTLTNHFYSGAAPLPQGRGMYPGLVAQADVVGFDLYPLQTLCRPDMLADDFAAQQQLAALAAGKPTFQWIEVRSMLCGDSGQVAITPATIEAESWLALAGGARGLGFFPNDWGAQVGSAIRQVTERVKQVEPALFRRPLPVSVDAGGSPVRASARAFDGALYVIAVNAGFTRARVRLTRPALADRTLEIAGARRNLSAHRGTITDVLPPLGVRIYVAPPQG